MHETGLPAQFRDDTLVSLLRSPASTAFLERHSAELFDNDKHLLRRVIHLLRVGQETARLGLMALRAAEIHEEHARIGTQRLVALLTPTFRRKTPGRFRSEKVSWASLVTRVANGNRWSGAWGSGL